MHISYFHDLVLTVMPGLDFVGPVVTRITRKYCAIWIFFHFHHWIRFMDCKISIKLHNIPCKCALETNVGSFAEEARSQGKRSERPDPQEAQTSRLQVHHKQQGALCVCARRKAIPFHSSERHSVSHWWKTVCRVCQANCYIILLSVTTFYLWPSQ